MNRAEVQQLRRRVDAQHQRELEEYRRKLDAIALVEQMLAEQGEEGAEAVAISNRQPSVASEAGIANDTTLREAVAGLFRAKPAWTIRELEAALRSQGVVFAAKKPTKSIHTAVYWLIKGHKVSVVRKGRGRIQGLYRAMPELTVAPTLNGSNGAM